LADKNLGWCAVHYDHYVKDGLLHLTNKEIYRQLSEQEAWAKIETIHEEIEAWLDEFEDDIMDHEVRYIQKHMNANSLSPFGQFYIVQNQKKYER
jgi:Holliday junction resolvasome RuvABC endonuclease subunit